MFIFGVVAKCVLGLKARTAKGFEVRGAKQRKVPEIVGLSPGVFRRAGRGADMDKAWAADILELDTGVDAAFRRYAIFGFMRLTKP